MPVTKTRPVERGIYRNSTNPDINDGVLEYTITGTAKSFRDADANGKDLPLSADSGVVQNLGPDVLKYFIGAVPTAARGLELAVGASRDLESLDELLEFRAICKNGAGSSSVVVQLFHQGSGV